MFDASVEKIAEHQTGLLGKETSSSPDPNDVIRFEEVLFDPNARDISILQEPSSVDPAFRRETGPWEYFADKIALRLDSMQSVNRSVFSEMASMLRDGLNNKKHSIEDLLLLQLRVGDAQIQIQVASKISEQVGRGVQTLYRQQG